MSSQPDDCVDRKVHETLMSYIAIAIADLEFIPPEKKTPEHQLARISSLIEHSEDEVVRTPDHTTALLDEMLRLRVATKKWQCSFRQRDSHKSDTQP